MYVIVYVMKSMIKINQDKVPVYSAASSNSDILCILRKDEILSLIDTQYIDGEKWNKVKIFSGKGFLQNIEYFKIKLAKVMIQHIFLRAEPSSDARILREFNRGELFYICDLIEEKGCSWYEVRTKHYSNNRGYILNDSSYQFEENNGHFE